MKPESLYSLSFSIPPIFYVLQCSLTFNLQNVTKSTYRLIFWEVHFMEPTPWVHKKVAIKNLPKIRAQIHVDSTQNSPRMAMKN